MQVIQGIIPSAQKVVVYGVEGIGKSTFASRFPAPLFIDTEGSTKHMDVARFPKPSSWTMLLEQVKHVRKNPILCKTLVIDTADWAELLCASDVCAKANKSNIEDFGYGKGYVYLAEEFGRLLNTLEDVIEQGIHVVITAHAKMRKFEQPDEMGAYDRWELKLQKQTAPLLKEWADLVLFANYKTIVVNVDGQGAEKGKNKAQSGKRVLYTTHHPCWDAKNRHSLADELPFDYSAIAHCISPASAAPEPVTPPSPPHETPPAQTKSLEELGFVEMTGPDPFELTAQDVMPPEQISMSTTSPPQDSGEPPAAIRPEIPKALADLMIKDQITEREIQAVVAKKGYYTENTPIEKYDPSFIDGVLVGAWFQVLAAVLEDQDQAAVHQKTGGMSNG